MYRMITMPDTAFCYHCSVHHSRAVMRQIVTKGGKRWRCIKSIEATKQGMEAREAFGRQMTANNKADTQASHLRMANPELNKDR
ncbi:MAG: hypothetical protein D4S02_04965 [Rhodocyclaceae bacterium]|nr:MAG: hypothetical protein D4S02_04965 [Rhodocyclaceae bacterium]